MLETPHVAIGAAIATKVANPALSLPLALLSHLLVEKVPHWNPHIFTEKDKTGVVSKKSLKIIILDSSLALLVGGFIAIRTYPDIKRVTVILLASFLSVLPDLIEAPYFFLNLNKPWIKKYIHWQRGLQQDTTFLFGMVTQTIVVIIALWWALT